MRTFIILSLLIMTNGALAKKSIRKVANVNEYSYMNIELEKSTWSQAGDFNTIEVSSLTEVDKENASENIIVKCYYSDSANQYGESSENNSRTYLMLGSYGGNLKDENDINTLTVAKPKYANKNKKFFPHCESSSIPLPTEVGKLRLGMKFRDVLKIMKGIPMNKYKKQRNFIMESKKQTPEGEADVILAIGCTFDKAEGLIGISVTQSTTY